MKRIIFFTVALFAATILIAQESASSLISNMLKKMETPHSYEIILGKQDNQYPDICITVYKSDQKIYMRNYVNKKLMEEDFFDGTDRYIINHSDSTIMRTGKIPPGDADIYMFELNELKLGYVDQTDAKAKQNNERKIGLYSLEENPDNAPEQTLLTYTIDPVQLVPKSVWWSAEGSLDLFANFKFDIVVSQSTFTPDIDKYPGYKMNDYRNL